ncbi:MAG: FAD-dependent oxidoreductase [Candidatus Lokiarchaeota archaeon]|nr:FAD-dependent oxidoreductase [Candidatus Lokiarchaeota archaeon]
MSKEIAWSKQVPVRYAADVVVIGGGIAGVIAACAAASQRARVILVEHFGALGGQGTIGGVQGFCGETTGQGHFFDEIQSDLDKFGAIAPYRLPRKGTFQGRQYDCDVLEIVLQELVLRHGVTLLLHARCVDVIKRGTEITHVLIHGKSGLEGIETRFVIDCTGEAEACVMAGCPTVKGRVPDEMQLPMSLIFFVTSAGPFSRLKPIPKDFFPWQPFRTRSEVIMNSTTRKPMGGAGVKIKIPGFDSTSTKSLSSAEIAGRREAFRVLEYYRGALKRRWNFSHFSPQIGIREGRRIVGEHTLTLEDVRLGREFDDAIAVGTYVLDAHKPDDPYRTYILPRDQLHVPPYQIPLRCLIPKGITNLLVAGRNMSADQLALGSARVMTTCGMMGHAAGSCAVQSMAEHRSPIEIATNTAAIKALQARLTSDGMRIDLGYYLGLAKKTDSPERS